MANGGAPVNHQITITVSASGEFTYTPTHVRASPNDTIDFQYLNAGNPGVFEVMFKHESPGNKMHIRHNTPKNQNGHHLQCQNKTGFFPYAAAVYDGVEVFVDVGCGDISVEDP